MNRFAPFALLLVLSLSACGAARPGPPSERPLTAARLYPLRAGSVWSYDVDTGEGLPVLAITRVLSANDSRAEVSSGSEPIVYLRRSDGLIRQDWDGYVLHEPIRLGERWPSHDGAEAEITAVDKQVSVPAGEFHGCVEVTEHGGTADKQVRTVFCPDVGPVEIESSMAIQLTGKVTRVLARLRGYDFSAAVAEAPASP